MIERLYYTNAQGQTIELSVQSDFHVNVSRDVDGMNDVNCKVTTATTMGQDGERFLSSTMEARDIEITGHLRATTLARQMELRRQLGHALSPKGRGTLTYVCGELKRQIDCYAEKCPSYTPGRWPKFIIQLRCPSPLWRETNEREVPVVTWTGSMVFDEEGGLELGETWEIGARSAERIVTVENTGDVPGGMAVVFIAQGAVVNPYLTNAQTQETIRLNTTMQAGDQIVVTTGYGQKEAVLERAGERTSIFRLLAAESVFLQLETGENLLAFGAQSGEDNLNVTVRHTNEYVGV